MSTLKVDGIRSNSATSDAITLANDGTCTANITNNLSNRNLIINGAMQVAQRGTSSTSSGYATVDRFRYLHGTVDNSPTQAQVDVASGTTPYNLGFRKAYKLTNADQTSGAQAATVVRLQTKIEAQDIANSGWNYTSASSYITFSFWIKSSIGQSFEGQILTEDGTVYSYPFSTGTLTADQWTKVTKTIPGNSNLQFDNNNGSGLNIQLMAFMGTTYSGTVTLNQWAAYNASARVPDMTSTWYTTNGSTLEVTGVQVEVSDYATSFEFRSYGDELARCQRYFQTGYVFTANDPYFHGYYGGGAGWMRYFFPVTLRTSPAISFNSYTQIQVYESGSNGWQNRDLTYGTSQITHLILFLNTPNHNYGKLLRLSGGSTYPIYYASAEL